MDAQSFLRINGARAGELVEALGGAAGNMAKAIEATVGPLAEMIEGKATTLAKGVEERAAPLAKSVEQRAAPLAEAVETTVETVAEDLEGKLESAAKGVVAGVKNFKFGTREGLILGAAVGIFAAIWLIRKIDREEAAERLRTAGARVSEKAQDLTSKASALTDKASAVRGAANERVGHVMAQIRGQTNGTVEDAKLRLSDPTSPVREVEIKPSSKEEPAAQEAPIATGLDEETQAAINDAAEEVERVEAEVREEASKLGLSNGMKIVAFDGTDIGRVQEVREEVFVLDRPKGPDLLVPLTEVARIEGTVAYLRIDVGQVPKMGWENA
jgi:hypothetical protein